MAVTEVGEVLGEVSLPDGVMLKFIHSYKTTFLFSKIKLSVTESHGFRVNVLFLWKLVSFSEQLCFKVKSSYLALTPWASLRWAPRGIFPLKAAFGQSGQGDLT